MTKGKDTGKVSGTYACAICDIVKNLDAAICVIDGAIAVSGERSLRSIERDSLESAAALLQIPLTNFRSEMRRLERNEEKVPEQCNDTKSESI